jgi:hypothetical protein
MQQLLRVELHVQRALISEEFLHEIPVLRVTRVSPDALPEVSEEVSFGWNCKLAVTIQERGEQRGAGSPGPDHENRFESKRRR